jgi:RNA polymerase sigma factor (TIGR02999 family)
VQPSSHEVTRLLAEYRRGDRQALDQLLPMIYAELRRTAARQLREKRAVHTLQPTALAHEAYLKLVGQREVQWQNRAHFLGCAAQAMRHILVDYARGRAAAKRGGGDARVTLTEGAAVAEERGIDVLALEEALGRLEQLNARQCRVVELRYYGGLSIEETAEVVGVSPATVKNDWVIARAWLHRQLCGVDEP